MLETLCYAVVFSMVWWGVWLGLCYYWMGRK